MSSALLCPVLKQSFTDNNGVPLAGGFLYSYTAGTSTPQATFTDATGSVPNTNPIVLDAAGRANVWLGTGSYKFVLTDSQGNTIFTTDQVTVQANGSATGGQTTFTIADNQSSSANVTNMLALSAVNQCVTFEYTIIRSNGTAKRREQGYVWLTYDSVNGWKLTRQGHGVDALNMGANGLTVTAGGQIQYQSDSMGGTYAGKMTWQINTAFPTEGI